MAPNMPQVKDSTNARRALWRTVYPGGNGQSLPLAAAPHIQTVAPTGEGCSWLELVEDDDAAAVLAARQRLEALVDLLEPVAPGDQAVDVDLPAQVQVDQLVERRVGAG